MEEFNNILFHIGKYKKQGERESFFIHRDLIFIYQKLQFFIDDVHNVFRNYNSLINDEIDNYKKFMQTIQQTMDKNKWKEVNRDIRYLIYKIWENQNT